MAIACTQCDQQKLECNLVICDGHFDDNPCPVKLCFQCARVKLKPTEYFCKDCVGKRTRQTATVLDSPHPGAKKQHVLSPDLITKVINAYKQDLPAIPVMPGFGDPDPLKLGSTAQSSNATTSTPSGMETALSLITKTMQSIEDKMVTSTQMSAVEEALLTQLNDKIDEVKEAFSKLELENKQLRTRVEI